MKSLIKLVTGSLIVTLASFAGSFCLYPMPVQAVASNSMDMSLMHMDEQGAQKSIHVMQGGNTAASALGTCTFDCVSTMPQAVATKKTSVDSVPNVLAIVPQTEQSLSSEFSLNPLDAIGTSPPSPDILFSVVKKE